MAIPALLGAAAKGMPYCVMPKIRQRTLSLAKEDCQTRCD